WNRVSSSSSSEEDDDEKTSEKWIGHTHKTYKNSRRTGKGPNGQSRNEDGSVQWKPWEESECLWIDQMRNIPDSCGLDQTVRKMPHPLAHYYASKVLETFETIQRIYKKRGLTNQGCGHCSRKIACRQRLHSKNYSFPAELSFVNDDCDNGDPCRISAINGTCPAPMNQKYSALYNLFSSVGQTGKSKRYSYDIPLWRCIKDPAADDKCLCCCGDYYPEASSGECVPVNNGNVYPPIDIEY
uniref:Uncharacterized protein n=1 Tax=Romanomermis culicivorax TaxID=13658 RepID=A0A915JZF3_ROMCU